MEKRFPDSRFEPRFDQRFDHIPPPPVKGIQYPLELLAFLFVIAPLLLIRRFESPRRRLSVWFFDLGRLVVGYASAEALLMIVLIPYMSLVRTYLHEDIGPPRGGPPGEGGGGGGGDKFPANNDWQTEKHRDWQAGKFGDPYDGAGGHPPGSSDPPPPPLPPAATQIVDATLRLLSRAVKISHDSLRESMSGDFGMGSDAGPTPGHESSPGPGPDFEPASNYPPRSGHGPDDFRKNDFKHKWFPFKAETTSLTLSTLELFPGLFFIYGIYIIFLYAGFRIKQIWLRRCKKIKFVRNANHDSWTAGYTDPENLHSSDSTFGRSKKSSQADLGFVSGNYGHPVRIGWAVQQTALFALTVFIVRMSLFFVCFRFPRATEAMSDFLFGWTANIRSHSTKRAVNTVLLPSLIYVIQFSLSDYLLKYKSSLSKRSVFFNIPIYSYGDDHSNVNQYPESYELQELSLPSPITANSDSNNTNRTVTNPGSNNDEELNNNFGDNQQRNRYSSLPNVSTFTAGPGPTTITTTGTTSSSIHAVSIPTTSGTTLRNFSAPIPHLSRGTSSIPATSMPRSRAVSPRHDTSNITSPSSNQSQHTQEESLERNIEDEIEETFNDIKELGKNAWEKVKNVDAKQNISLAMNSGLRFGIVTATLLNSVAVSATANARPFLFNGPNSASGFMSPGGSFYNNRNNNYNTNNDYNDNTDNGMSISNNASNNIIDNDDDDEDMYGPVSGSVGNNGLRGLPSRQPNENTRRNLRNNEYDNSNDSQTSTINMDEHNTTNEDQNTNVGDDVNGELSNNDNGNTNRSRELVRQRVLRNSHVANGSTRSNYSPSSTQTSSNSSTTGLSANASGSSSPTSSAQSIMETYRLNEVDDEDGPPSYDDSQRQHLELLRDRNRAEQHRRVIQDLKRA